MNVKAELILEVDGREVYRGESKSFLQNFGKIFYGLASSPANAALSTGGIIASVSVTKPDGTSASAWVEWYGSSGSYGSGGAPMGCNAPDNDDSFGIVVGGSSTAVSPTQYTLGTKISHGTGSGQLDYNVHTVTTSFSATYSYVDFVRTFTNSSGGDVIVREVGIIGRNYFIYYISGGSSTVQNDVKYLIARDVLPTPVTVPNLASLTVRYRVSLST